MFGGVSNGINTSIEKYYQNWIMLEVSLPEIFRKFALISYLPTDVIILGGEKDGKNSDSVYKFNTVDNSFEKLQDLPKDFCTNSNSHVAMYQNIIYLLESSRNIIKYCI